MLAADINTFIFDLQQDKREIDELLNGANDAIASAYKDLAPDLVPTKVEVNIAKSSVGEWIDYSADTITGVFVFEGLTSAMESAWKSYLLNEGRIAEAAFVEVLELPVWLKFGRGVGGAAAATAATLAVDAIISSITGAIQRGKLRGMIKDCVGPRIQQQKHVLIADKVKNTLRAVMYSYNAIAGTTKDADMLNQIATNLVAQHHIDVNSITDKSSKDLLAGLDKARSAWTEED